MLFASFPYALFLPPVVLAYWLLPRRLAPLVLALASLVFYASWSAPYLALIAVDVGVAWAGARGIAAARAAQRSPSAVLGLTVGTLLGLLAFFKYSRLLAGLVAPLFGATVPAVYPALPLGISFYTFQLLGYVIDVHRGAPVERRPERLALFVGFFPHLIAGPIVRTYELIPQLFRRVPFDSARFASGLELLAYGLFKKAVVADNLAVYVNPVFQFAHLAGGLDVIGATLAFGAQIYCDFSGYTDMARGSARLLGIELPINFDAPYTSVTVTEFWRRWHITLSRWLRDYLYVSLGGNRRGPARTLANLFVTMALGGLWHGANLTFVAWGTYHGLLLAAERSTGTRGAPSGPLARALRTAGTFVLVQIGWAIFRADDFATLGTLAARLATDPLATRLRFGTATWAPLWIAFYVAHALSARLRASRELDAVLTRPVVAGSWLALATVLVVVFGGPETTFIYFQF